MDLIKSEMIGFKSKRKNLRELEQVGKSNIPRDRVRKALRAGKRISASGKVYWETRQNRSDASGSDI